MSVSHFTLFYWIHSVACSHPFFYERPSRFTCLHHIRRVSRLSLIYTFFWFVFVSKQILDLSVHNEVESPFLLNHSRGVSHQVRHGISNMEDLEARSHFKPRSIWPTVPVVLPLLHILAVKLSYCMRSRSSPVYTYRAILCLSWIFGAISANI